MKFDPSETSSRLRDLDLSPSSSLSSSLPLLFIESHLPRIVNAIQEDNLFTFNPMAEEELNRIVTLLTAGADECFKPLALIELADHLVVFQSYELAALTYKEAVSLCAQFLQTQTNLPSHFGLILHDGLLGYAKISRHGSPLDQQVSQKILMLLGTAFESTEAISYL
jgi:hypothetical protein